MLPPGDDIQLTVEFQPSSNTLPTSHNHPLTNRIFMNVSMARQLEAILCLCCVRVTAVFEIPTRLYTETCRELAGTFLLGCM